MSLLNVFNESTNKDYITTLLRRKHPLFSKKSLFLKPLKNLLDMLKLSLISFKLFCKIKIKTTFS